MRKVCLIITIALIAANAMGADLLNLIRKIKVDPDGVKGAVDGCEFSKDGLYIAASDNHGECRIYKTSDGSFVDKVTHYYIGGTCAKKDAELNAVLFSHDGAFLATGRNDDGTKIWSTDDYSLKKHLVDGTETDGADFSPDNKWFATGSDKNLNIYELPEFNFVKTISGGSGAVNSVDFSADSKFIAFGLSNGKVGIIRVSDWEVIKWLTSSGSVKSVRYSPDMQYLAYSGRDQRCRVYRTSDWVREADIIHSGNETALPCDDDDSNAAVEALDWSSDSEYLFTGGLITGKLHVWSRSDWSEVGWVQAQENNRQIEYIDVFENKVVVGGDEGYIYLYEFNPTAATVQQKSAKVSHDNFYLHQNYPNPFNTHTSIKFLLPRFSDITLKVFNTYGQEVANLVSQELPAGEYKVQFNANNLPSGIYIAKLQVGDKMKTQKMLFLR